jgi:peptidoglycan/xylan/chitin deacetylase (PgdA/CDA1 family)
MRFAYKTRLKAGWGSFVALTGIPHVVRTAVRHHALVLTYHGVLPPAPESYLDRQAIDAELFNAQLAWLTRYYDVLPLSSIVEGLDAGRRFSNCTAALTFDDGLRNVLTTALPLLERHRVPATVFVCADYVGSATPLWMDQVNALVIGTERSRITFAVNGDSGSYSLSGMASRERAAHLIRNRLKGLAPSDRDRAVLRLREMCQPLTAPEAWGPRTDLLTWEDLRAMSTRGVEIGAHGCTHTTLAALDAEAARDEIRRSKETIERQLGRSCAFFSYPNGTRKDFSFQHQHLLRQAGYRAAVTQIRGFNGPHTNPMTLRRINVSRAPSLGHFIAKLSLLAQ